jgi:hypothetical protein
MGVIPIAVPTFYEHFPSWFQTVFDSGISSAAVTAVVLNLLFNVRRGRTDREAALFAESPTVGVTPDYDVPGGKPAVPGALDSDAQGTVGAREYATRSSTGA